MFSKFIVLIAVASIVVSTSNALGKSFGSSLDGGYGRSSVSSVNSPSPGDGGSTPGGSPPELPPQEGGYKFDWQPMFYLDFDIGQKVTNMTLHNPSCTEPNTLILDDYTGGLRVERYNFVDVGFPYEAPWWYDISPDYSGNISSFIGLIPIKSSQLQSVQYVNSPSEISRLPLVTEVPKRAEDLNSWAPDESVSYLSSGGLIFYAGFNFGNIGPTVTAVAKGTWSIEVVKNPLDMVYVKVTKGKLETLSLDLGAGLVSVGVAEFRGADQGFSFLINLATINGRHAYEDLIRGNVGAIQKLSVTNPYDVTYIEAERVLSKGKLFNFVFGWPFIANIYFTSGKIQAFSQTDMILEKSKVSVNYGVYIQELRSQLFTHHKNKTVTFAGANYSVTNQKNEETKGYFGQYSIDIMDDNSSQKDIRGFIKEIISKTGLAEQAYVNVPAVNHNDYDYSGAHIEVIFSKNQTDRMIATAEQLGSRNFVATYLAYVDQYFNEHGDSWGLCPHGGQCAQTTKTYTHIALQNMWYALMKMKANNRNPESFVSAYADFGKGLSQNAFALQVALNLAGEGTEVYYRIEGSRISLYELFMTTTSVPGEYKLITAPGEPLPKHAPVGRAGRHRGVLANPEKQITQHNY